MIPLNLNAHLIDRTTGNLYYFGVHAGDDSCNFVASPTELGVVDDRDRSMPVPGYGSVFVTYRQEQSSLASGASESRWLDFRPVGESDDYASDLGGFTVHKSFRQSDDLLYMEIILSNPSSSALRIDELAVSVPVNNNYTDFRYRPSYMYEKRVYEHIYPGGTSGYQIMQRLNGDAPLAYAIPLKETSFEHAAHLPGTTSLVREGIPNHSWPGSSVIYLHAKGYLERNGYQEIMGRGSATSRLLLPGEEASYLIEIGMTDGMESFRSLLVERGKLAVTAIPAMVSPIDSPFTLLVRSRSTVSLESSDRYSAVLTGSSGDRHTFRLEFREPGEYEITIRNAEGGSAPVLVHITEPVKELVRRRADFIARHQVYRKEGDALNGAILCYSRREFIGNRPYPQGILAQEDDIWGSGSYEGGITEAMFLAIKNAADPEPGEIAVLEAYVRDYVRRYLQNPETNEVFWWCGNFNSVRSFNYMHVANLYYYMHVIAKTYQATELFDSNEYLLLAYSTLMKMFERARKMDLVVGNMGGEVMFRTLHAMEDIYVPEYYELLLRVNEFQRNLFEHNVPFGSECAYDNTGYEMVMTMADAYDDTAWMERLAKIMLAVRGEQPVWWWHGSDIRWWDAERDFSECCHHYTSPLNSGGLLRALERGLLPIGHETLSTIHGGTLGAFSKIHADGTGSMSYCWEQESSNFGFHAFSGDIGLGLFGALTDFGAYVYQPAGESLQGYLCDARDDAESGMLDVRPVSGAGNRIAWHLADKEGGSSRGRVALTAGFIERLLWNRRTGTIEIVAHNDTSYAYRNEIAFTLPVPLYMELTVNGQRTLLRKIADHEAKASFAIGSRERVAIVLKVR
ncbi:DUF5695 domain-containing protein [Paenibacillus spongiae]|uniref:DUF5695 domain-containing protein n=1 Tax=Paenibacillus spongiae TaxID=2909671 RepID=A0ABY5S451_9BACL|nr:DUF5695 domain-containing protein [Paenibacillus spongiae]UVI27330.1 DUF5695 domain-containing protein [Paenibacillus spongiae]